MMTDSGNAAVSEACIQSCVLKAFWSCWRGCFYTCPVGHNETQINPGYYYGAGRNGGNLI
ncbi:Uncharacterized protein dnm_054790 [Desulfonema magnum]|uniref:Uncharacterized protein n=1 Tax=Desulfonema magnum TaxID=45655 RepID=A0A975GPW4_9BACT|nr:Uncharacterized protein dnm_054790 [Desulfonema magnum]